MNLTHLSRRTLILVPMLLFASPSNLALGQDYGQFQASTFSADNEVVLVSWHSEVGLERLARARHKDDFHQLAHHFQPQINPLYCSIATSVMLLNAMRIPKGLAPSQKQLEVQPPEDWGGDIVPYPAYSQWTFLNEMTDKIKDRGVIDFRKAADGTSEHDPGLQLNELRRILEAYDTEVQLFYADKEISEGVDAFRRDVLSVLGDSERFIVVNFVGNLIGTTTGGHVSPLAAYDEASDSVLIVDVAGHKNPWYWAPVSHLYQSMNTKDSDAYRGWLIVSDGAPRQ